MIIGHMGTAHDLLLTKTHQFFGYGYVATCVVWISNACFLMGMMGARTLQFLGEKPPYLSVSFDAGTSTSGKCDELLSGLASICAIYLIWEGNLLACLLSFLTKIASSCIFYTPINPLLTHFIACHFTRLVIVESVNLLCHAYQQ